MRLHILAAIVTVVVLQTSSMSVSVSQPIVPRVAFWCGKVNQHVDMVSGVWVTDEDGVSGCVDTSDKIAILRYCQQTYPHITVVNVFEDEEKTLYKWCERGNKNCDYHSTKPTFVCVAGHFEAPRLEVPRGCHFTHLYEPRHCKNEDTWQQAAEHECRRGRQVVLSKGMLVECGHNVYRGVEFVCCPPFESEMTPEAQPTPLKIEEQTVTQELIPTEEPEAPEEPELTDEPEPTARIRQGHHPLVHHALISPRECSRGVLSDQYKTMRKEMDTNQKQNLRKIVGVYRRQKEAADQLREREPKAAQAMMDTVRSKVRERVEAAESQISREHHQLKAQYRHQLAKCYEQKMCTVAQMFAVVLHEDQNQAEGIIQHVASVINRQLAMKYKKASIEDKLKDGDSMDSVRELTALKRFGHRVDQDLNFTRTFLVLAARMLRGINVQLQDCPLVPPSEHKTPEPESERPPLPDIGLVLEPGPVLIDHVDETEAPETTSKPSASVPDISLIFGPGPVMIEPHETGVSKQDQATEPPATVTESNPTVKEVQEEPEAVVDIGNEQMHDDQDHHHEHHDHDNMVDGAHEAHIHHHPGPHKGDINGKLPVFVTGGPEESIDDKEHLDEKTSGTKIYLGVSLGLAGAAALVAMVFLVVYAIRRRYYSNSLTVETTAIADDERSVDDMEADLQDHGFVNPTYKLFDEMEDNQ